MRFEVHFTNTWTLNAQPACVESTELRRVWHRQQELLGWEAKHGSDTDSVLIDCETGFPFGKELLLQVSTHFAYARLSLKTAYFNLDALDGTRSAACDVFVITECLVFQNQLRFADKSNKRNSQISSAVTVITDLYSLLQGEALTYQGAFAVTWVTVSR